MTQRRAAASTVPRGRHLLAATVLAMLAPLGLAQLSLRGEIGIASDAAVTSSGGNLSDRIGVVYSLHLEAGYALDQVTLNLVLDPAAIVPDPTPAGPGKTVTEPLFEPGLTEAYLLWRGDSADLSAGVERLPLETARLSIPFSLEPRGETGLPKGLLGARASLFTGPWRIRPAIVYRSPDLGAVLSVRRDFGSFELEAHAVYLDRFAAGTGGSGLVGNLVLYGEAWLLTDPLDGRGALGLSGFLGNGLWTLEAAYAPLPTAPDTGAFPQLAGQLNLPLDDSGSLEIGVGTGLIDSVLNPDSSTFQGLASVTYSYSAPNFLFTVGPSLRHTEFGTRYGIGLELKEFF